MAYSVIDPEQFLSDGIFLERDFLEKAETYSWEEYRDKHVLVRGCNSAIIPPWAFMYISGKLVPLAKTVRYGNEHDNIVVYRTDNDNKEVKPPSKALKK